MIFFCFFYVWIMNQVTDFSVVLFPNNHALTLHFHVGDMQITCFDFEWIARLCCISEMWIQRTRTTEA